MANLASFRINQTADGSFGYARRDIVPTSSATELELEAENAGLVYRWEIIQPPGSNVPIGSSTAQFATFGAEIDGGYLVKLTVNPGAADEDVMVLYFGIGTDINGELFCLPALNETTQDNSLGHTEWGWWEKLYTFLRELASLAGSGGGGGDTFFEAGTGTDSLQRIDFGDAQGNNSWAFGSGSEAAGDGSWTFGSRAVAEGDGAFAFGDSSYAEGAYSFAFGTEVRSLAGASVFGYGYSSAFHHSLSVGYSNAVGRTHVYPQSLRIPVNGYTMTYGVPSRLYIDPNRGLEIGPVPPLSYMNIAFHVVAKSDNGSGGAPAIVTFDGEVVAISSAADITYQDWTITKTISSGTLVYHEDLWELSIPATSSDLTALEFVIVQDGLHGHPNVVWSGYLDIAIVSSTAGGGLD
jgi:hypothetical protein